MNRVVAILFASFMSLAAIADEKVLLEYAPGPVANPLKGLVPYAGDENVHFPHSLEFNYVGFTDLMKGDETFDWQPLEDLLDEISSRGHQAVFRVYLEYPEKKNVIPKFLLDDGLKVHRYLNTNTQPLPPAEVETPDYEDKNLRRALKNFIAAFGEKKDDWFYMPALKQAGSAAVEKWKTHPIGGEIRPEAWGKVFDAKPGDKRIQDFRECVNQTHVSWLMDSGMFEKKSRKDRMLRAETEVRRMGYEFHVPAVSVSLQQKKLKVTLELENRGVAPFYYDWNAEYGLLAEGKVVKTVVASGKIKGLLPGDQPREWNDTLDLSDLPPARYTLAVRVPNTLPHGLPVRFANATQDRDVDGWLSLTTIECEP